MDPISLPVLRIRLTSPSSADVIFEAGTDGHPEPVTGCTLADLGLPEGERSTHSGPRFDLKAVARALPGGRLDPVWLEVPSPRGHLHVLPWERLLLGLNRPIWRASRTGPLPRLGAPSLTVAMCTGGWPDTPRGLPEDPTEAWSVPAGRRADVQVFTDPPPPTGRPPVDLTDPWLLGVRDALDGRALDVLHLVAPGVFTGDRGAVVRPAGATEQATHSPDASPVGAAEISAFLGQTGAWCLVLTGSSHYGSMAALRDVADAVATARPCVVLTQDADEPHEPRSGLIPGRNLGPLFGRVFDTEAAGKSPPASPAVACWVAPSFVDGTAVRAAPHRMGPLARAALDRDRAPGWVAAYLRDLELRDDELLPDGPGGLADPDVAVARAHLTELLDDLVDRYGTTEG